MTMDMELNCTPKSVFATLPKTTRGMPFVLGGDPKGKNFLYCNGNGVVIRDIENPEICDIYTEHSVPTTVAKYSPTGFYIASGDTSGKIRIWDTTQKTHILKNEYQFISGAVRDIAWSPDQQRLALVGEGRDRFGHVFLFETGTSNGSLSGQSKCVNSIDFRPTRPFRIITASEDSTVALFEGPPFKFKTNYQQHTRFAHCARYSSDGALFASCGADGKLFLYEGTDGTPKGEFVDASCKGAAHSGGVYALSWSPDNKQILTCSGDKSCKIWDVESTSLVCTFKFGNQIEDQQLSCLWQGDHVLSVSLAGFIYYLDQNNPETPIRVLKGHNKPITALDVDREKNTIYTGDSEGAITFTDASTGVSDRLPHKPHNVQIQEVKVAGNDMTTISMDDTIAFSQLSNSSKPEQLKLNSQPRGVATSSDSSLCIVASFKEVCVFRNKHLVCSLPVDYEPTCVALHPDEKIVAVGSGGQDNKVRIFELNDNALTLQKELSHNGNITAVAYSPSGGHLCVSDAARKVVPYSVPDYENASSKDWTFHSARVNCLAWNPDSRHIATGSLDTNIIVWDLERSGEHPLIIKGAHTMSQITKVAWIDENTIVSTGQDSNIKQWTIHF